MPALQFGRLGESQLTQPIQQPGSLQIVGRGSHQLSAHVHELPSKQGLFAVFSMVAHDRSTTAMRLLHQVGGARGLTSKDQGIQQGLSGEPHGEQQFDFCCSVVLGGVWKSC
eukprot:4264854-Alexandrium_andersonii.AAC.1